MGSIKSMIGLVDKVTAPLKVINRNLDQNANKFKASGDASDRMGKTAQSAMNNASRATRSFSSVIGTVPDALNRVNGAMNSFNTKSNSLFRTLTGVALAQKAFGMVTNQVSSAIGRMDTLNNYPAVMSNLGISTDKAEESIKRMSDKLQGLPTKLQDGAAAVQRFTSANGNVEASTEMFLALNNAILAGGADMQTQQSAMEQLSQAYAKGKPDMMEWRSAMTAMPAQLKQVAQAMGFVSADALGEALRNGKTSMNEFMATLVKMNTESVNGFKTLEEQARNATGGFATSIENMKSAVTRGITSMVENINKVLESSGLPKIQEIISNIGKTIEQILKGVGAVIGRVIKWVAEHREELAKLAKTIISVAVAWGVVSTVISTIIGLVTTITTIVSTFGTVLGGVFGAATIAAIVGVSNAVSDLFDWFSKLHEETGGDWAKDIEIIFARARVTIAKFSYFFQNVTANIMNAWDTMCLGFKIAFKAVGAFILTVASVIVGAVETVINAVIGMVNNLMRQAGATEEMLMEQNWNWSSSLANKVNELGSSIEDDTIETDRKINERYDKVKAAKDAIPEAQKEYEEIRARITKSTGSKDKGTKVKNPKLDKIDTNTDTTAKNTAKISKQLAANGEVLKYIKDYATQKAVNRYTSSNIKVNMTNNNSISSDMDIDGVVSKLKSTIETELASSAEGVHA